MACQLVYTSASRGLAGGRSGFCTVARPKEMRDLLVTALEQISTYHHLRTGETSADPNPVISTFRILDLRSTRYYILSKIRDCGLDYTNRTNHIAHHLIFLGSELSSAPSPAWILRHWPGWLTTWHGEARFLGPGDEITSFTRPSGRETRCWHQLTGDPAKAALPISKKFSQNCGFLIPTGQEETLLDYFHESLQILLPADGNTTSLWQLPFTTFIQASDSPGDFRWKGTWPSQASILPPPILDLTNPADLPEPEPLLAQAARDGTPPPDTAVLPAAPPIAVTPAAASQPLSGNSIRLNLNPANESLPELKPAPPAPKPISSSLKKKGLAQDEPKSSSTLWMAIAALVVIGALTGYLISMSLTKKPTEITVPQLQPLPVADTNFPTTLPAVTNLTPPPTNTAPEPKPETNTPPPTPPPTPTIVNLDGLQANGLPKRTTYFAIGSLKGNGIDLADPTLSESISTALGKTSEFRALRIAGTPDLSTPPTEAWSQHYPGLTEITPGKIYSPTLEEILTYHTQGSTLTLKSPSCDQVLLLPMLPPDTTPFQILVIQSSSLHDTPLLKLNRSWLEESTSSDSTHIVTILPDKWKALQDQLRPTAPGNWSLHTAADLSTLVASTDTPPNPSIPTMTLGLTASELAQIADLKKNIDQARETAKKYDSLLQARDALFAPPFNDFGEIFFSMDEATMTKLIGNMEKVLNDTSKGQKEKAPARALLEKYKPRLELLTFASYQKSQSRTKDDTMPKDYTEYVRKVLESREDDLIRGVFLNQKSEDFLPEEPSQKTPTDFIAAGHEFSDPANLPNIDAKKTEALKLSLKAWNKIFTQKNLYFVSPFLNSPDLLKMTMRNEVTDFFDSTNTAYLQVMEAKLAALEKRRNLYKQGLKSVGDIFLIWESCGEFSNIALFSEN